MTKAENIDVVRAQRAQVVGRLASRFARAFQERAVARIHERGYEDYRLGDNPALMHLDMAGSRISDIAAGAGVTKQAISQTVYGLQERGVVTKVQDPDDGRAQRVALTSYGRQMMTDSLEVVFELDREMANALPRGRLALLKRDLQTLLSLMESHTEVGA